VHFETEGLEGELDPEQQLVLFRVLQEALANAARHAQARRVEIRLRFAETVVGLQVRDDGHGFDPAQVAAGHYGLRNMRERTARVGGMVRIDSGPGRGACIDVEVPRRGSSD
jgi:two-component system, NarL family, sensor histidine kinase DegS